MLIEARRGVRFVVEVGWTSQPSTPSPPTSRMDDTLIVSCQSPFDIRGQDQDLRRLLNNRRGRSPR